MGGRERGDWGTRVGELSLRGREAREKSLDDFWFLELLRSIALGFRT